MQLDLAGSDDGVALLDASEDGHLVAARRPDGDEGLPGDELGLALRIVALTLDHIDRVAVRIVGDRGLRQRHVCPGEPMAISTVAYIPGSSLWSAFFSIARICTLRLPISTFGLTAEISPAKV